MLVHPKLIKAEKTSRGGLNQTVFITSTEGQYILRGDPNPGQLQLGKFMVDNLYTKTNTPVPFPHNIDLSSDIFGWHYSLMPRLGGVHVDTEEIKGSLSVEDERMIARVFGQNLAGMQKFTAEKAGLYDPYTEGIVPFEQLCREQHEFISGKAVSRCNALAVYYNGQTLSEVTIGDVQIAPLPKQVIEEIANESETLNCAGQSRWRNCTICANRCTAHWRH